MMTNRNPETALRCDAASEEAKTKLREFVRLSYDLNVGEKGHWKPWKTTTVMSTNAVLRLVDRLLASGHSEILTSRFDQDCLESVFSVVRARQRRPTCIQFSYNLKIITLTQYMRGIRGSSYNLDDQVHLIGLADFLRRRRLVHE